MSRITRISQTKRGRFALFHEEGFLFSVDGETLAKSGLAVGDKAGEADLSALKDQSDTRKACDAALRYLSLRAHGQQELYQKLLLRYDEHTAAAALAKMCDAGLMNDAVFAQAKAEGMAQRGKSPFEIRRKLITLGIDKQLAEAAVDALELDGAYVAMALVKKRYMDKLAAGEAQKVKAALARRGFSHSDITRALGMLPEAEDLPPNEEIDF